MDIAQQSTCRQRHGAVIIRGGRVLAVGVNRDRNNPRVLSDPKDNCSTHAEVAAIRAGGNIVGGVIYVARVNRSGHALLSRPCDSCFTSILRSGIKRVVYTV